MTGIAIFVVGLPLAGLLKRNITYHLQGYYRIGGALMIPGSLRSLVSSAIGKKGVARP